ncbi:MAG: ferredoxin [Puniceicoccales bacterium]|jgi:ferredoxin|nr:ferredoxin [Puniceicoccales bacterium]
MASKEDRIEENAPGRFYVDDQCIGCDMCRNLAPDFFGEASEGGSFVKKQPLLPQDIEICLEAMDSCPAEAIGDDGDDSDEEEEND